LRILKGINANFDPEDFPGIFFVMKTMEFLYLIPAKG